MLDFQKKILGPAGPQVFIFGCQNKYSGHQKLYLRTKGFIFLKDNGLSLVYVFPKKKVTWGPGWRPGVKIWSPLSKSWSHRCPHRSQHRALVFKCVKHYACNPNLHVAVIYYACTACMYPALFGLLLRMNGMQQTQSDQACLDLLSLVI